MKIFYIICAKNVFQRRNCQLHAIRFIWLVFSLTSTQAFFFENDVNVSVGIINRLMLSWVAKKVDCFNLQQCSKTFRQLTIHYRIASTRTVINVLCFLRISKRGNFPPTTFQFSRDTGRIYAIFRYSR